MNSDLSNSLSWQIRHQTIYTYNQPVFLKPHLLRLHPRCNAWQKLLNFSLTVTPEPTGMAHLNDLDGNHLIQLWLTQPTEKFILTVESQVETYISNPFNYLLEPWALKLPIDYPSSLLNQLKPYLKFYSFAPDPIAIQLAQEISYQVHGETLSFLSTLNQHLYENCDYLIREEGDPWTAGVTWNQKKQGSCRDLTVLFLEACRAVGLAARFVSGYQEGDRDQKAWDLHAWAEVYLPGGGWRGFDPTHGLAVGDRHVALVASALPSYAAPVTGTVTPAKSMLESGKPHQSQIETEIVIQIKASN